MSEARNRRRLGAAPKEGAGLSVKLHTVHVHDPIYKHVEREAKYLEAAALEAGRLLPVSVDRLIENLCIEALIARSRNRDKERREEALVKTVEEALEERLKR